MTAMPQAVTSWTLREVAADDTRGLDRIADLHMELLGFGPMAGLGRRFVRDICYAAHMEDGLLRVALVEVEGEPAGFVAYTSRSIGFHRSGLKQHWFRAGVGVALSLLRDPRRVVKLVRALKVLMSRRGETVLGEDPLGEVVCVAARKQYLTSAFVKRSGLRLSQTLIGYAQGRLTHAGTGKMRMIVDADNKPVLMLYHLMGAHFEPYEQGGEPQVHVWFDLAAPTPGDALPECWNAPPPSSRTAAIPSTWNEYWEGMEDRQAVFRIEAADYARRVRESLRPQATTRVLDFGCGFGHTARELSPFVGSVAVWDGSSRVRQQAAMRLRDLANIEYLDLRDPGQPTVTSAYDVILVHSVVQYMSEAEFKQWLARWLRMLKPGGRLVLSDLIGPDASGLKGEVATYLKFAARNGFFWNALMAGLREVGSYAKARESRPLLTMAPPTLTQWAADAGWAVEWLPHNLSYRDSRRTAVLTQRASS